MTAIAAAQLPTYDHLPGVLEAPAIEAHVEIHRRYARSVRRSADGLRHYETLEEYFLARGLAPGDDARQLYNHNVYWQTLSLHAGGAPYGASEIALAHGGYRWPVFRRRFLELGDGQFASGWLWLVATPVDGEWALDVEAAPDAQWPECIETDGQFERIMGVVDLWEHAYYLEYLYERRRYLTAVLKHALNWTHINHRLDALPPLS